MQVSVSLKSLGYIMIATVIAVCLVTPPANALTLTPTFVQNNANFSGSSHTSIATSFSSSNTAHNLIIAYVVWGNSASSATVTDSAGNTYTPAASAISNGSNALTQVFYAKDIIGGANTVTATFNTSAGFQFLYVHEYANVDLTNPLDGTASASGFGTTVDSGPITTTSATELLFSGSMSFAAQSSGSGWTTRSTLFNGLTQDKVVNSTGTYNATATIGSSQGWVIQAAGFRARQVPVASSNTTITAAVTAVISISTLSSVSMTLAPTAGGVVSSSNDTVTVSTNDTAGYTLTLANNSGSNTNLVSGSNTIAASAGTQASPTTLANNTWGYAVANLGGFDTSYSAETNNGSSTSKWAGTPVSGSPNTIKTTNSTATNDTTVVWYAAKATSTQPAGTYSGTVTYTAIAN